MEMVGKMFGRVSNVEHDISLDKLLEGAPETREKSHFRRTLQVRMQNKLEVDQFKAKLLNESQHEAKALST